MRIFDTVIEAKHGSISSYKASIMHSCNFITKLFIPACISSSTLSNCRLYREELATSFLKLLYTIQELCSLCPSLANKQLDSLNDYNEKYASTCFVLLDHKASIEEVTFCMGQHQSPAWDPLDSISKVDKILCPFVISPDHKPQDLHQWNKKFKQ